MSDKLTCDWKIKILTPVHIGGAQEKHWQEGLDFVIRKGKVYFLDQNKLIKHWKIDKYSNALAKGKMEELTDTINLREFSSRIEKISGKTREIKQHIKSQASGKPIIPGSSLKGAIRSVLFNYLLGQNPTIQSKGNKYIENDVFGKIDKDFMRFLQVGDVEFEKTEIVNTKIFTLSNNHGDFYSQWKDRRSGGDRNFKPRDFATGYECIAPDQYASARIRLDLEGFRKAKGNGKVHVPNGLEHIFNEQFEDCLFGLLQQHTQGYFRKEVAYFQQYAGSAEHSAELSDAINSLGTKIENEQFASLRLAAGSGFHSITGDWHYPESHIINEVWGDPYEKKRNGTPNPQFDRDYHRFNIRPNARKRYKNKVKWKTRKVAFVLSDNTIAFQPLGYIQFVPTYYYDDHIGPKLEAKKQEKLDKKRKEEAENKRLAEEAKRKAEEAKKPKLTQASKIKKKTEYVDVEVLEWKFRKLKVKPYVEGFEDTIYELKFPSEVDKGTIMILKMKLVAKGKKLQHEGRPRPK